MVDQIATVHDRFIPIFRIFKGIGLSNAIRYAGQFHIFSILVYDTAPTKENPVFRGFTERRMVALFPCQT